MLSKYRGLPYLVALCQAHEVVHIGRHSQDEQGVQAESCKRGLKSTISDDSFTYVIGWSPQPGDAGHDSSGVKQDLEEFFAESHSTNEIDLSTALGSDSSDGGQNPAFIDLMGEILTQEHQQYQIAHELNLVTWAEKDADFWEWFWPWYTQLDNTWSFDHEPGFVQTDHNFELDWLQKHTSGFSEIIDSTYIADSSDSAQWDQAAWDAYWRNYNVAEHDKEGYIYQASSGDEQDGQDSICPDGSFLNDASSCMPCPPGCEHCLSLGHCFACSNNFEAVTGPDFGFCFPRCFHGMYRQTMYSDKNDLLWQIGVPATELETDADMELVIPPHLMMQTCKPCADNCRGCFSSAADSTLFCYECLHGYLFDEQSEQCVADPSWATTKSEIKVRADKRFISQCDQVRLRIDAEAGFDPGESLREIRWNVLVTGMDVDDELRMMVQQAIRGSIGQPALQFNRSFTQKLAVGASIKVVGFAVGKNGYTVTDSETVEVTHEASYSLTFDQSYFISARDGLTINVRKRQESCPNAVSTARDLDESDLKRLTCKLLTIERDVILDELPECRISQNTLEPGMTYLVQLTWSPKDEPSQLDAQMQPEPVKYFARVMTQKPLVQCFFERGNEFVFDANRILSSPLRLNYIVLGDAQYVSQVSWSYTIDDSQETAASTVQPFEPSADHSIEIGGKIIDQIREKEDKPVELKIKLSLQMESQANPTSGLMLQPLAECQIKLTAIDTGSSSSLPLELSIENAASSNRFIDTQTSQKFYCHQAGDNTSPGKDLLKLTMRAENQDGRVFVQSSSDALSNSLTIGAVELSGTSSLKVMCKADPVDKFAVGRTQTDFVSGAQGDKVGILVSPATGVAFSTLFTIVVVKPANEALNCSIGYMNKAGEVVIDQASAGLLFSSERQSLQTTLPYVDDLDDQNLRTHIVFARCYDVLGRQKTAQVKTQIEDRIPDFVTDIGESSLIDILTRKVTSASESTTTSVSDIILLSESLPFLIAQKHAGDDASLAQDAIFAITNAIAKYKALKPGQVQQLSQVLLGITEIIAADEEDADLPRKKELAGRALAAIRKVISFNNNATVQVPIEQESMVLTAFEALAQCVDNLITFAGKHGAEPDFIETIQGVVKDDFFANGLNRVALSLLHKVGPSPTNRKFTLQNFAFDIQLLTVDQAKELGGAQVALLSTDGSEKQVAVSVPLDVELFGGFDSITLASSTIPNVAGSRSDSLARKQVNSVASSQLLSVFVSVSVRALNDSQAAPDTVNMAEIKIENLQEPILIEIPINVEQVTDFNRVKCMFLNETVDRWQSLGLSDSCPEPTTFANQAKDRVSCCTTHLTTFCVQEVGYKADDDQQLKQDAAVSMTTHLDFKSTKAPLAFIFMVNALLVFLTLVGCRLDRGKLLIFKPDLGRQDIAGATSQKRKPGHYPAPSLSDSIQRPVTSVQVELSPIQMRNEGDLNVEPIDMNQIKLEVDNVVVAENAQSSTSSASIQVSQISAVSMVSMCDLKIETPVKDEIKEKAIHQNFTRLLCNAFKFYGRILAVFFSHDQLLSRAFKALNLATQAMLVATIVSVTGVLTSHEAHGWNLASDEILTTFFIMRIAQFLLGFGLARSESTSRCFSLASLALFIVVYFLSTAIVFSTLARESSGVQWTLIRAILLCLAIELVLWDMLLMPLTLASLAKCCKRRKGVFKHFGGLLV